MSGSVSYIYKHLFHTSISFLLLFFILGQFFSLSFTFCTYLFLNGQLHYLLESVCFKGYYCLNFSNHIFIFQRCNISFIDKILPFMGVIATWKSLRILISNCNYFSIFSCFLIYSFALRVKTIYWVYWGLPF